MLQTSEQDVQKKKKKIERKIRVDLVTLSIATMVVGNVEKEKCD